MFFGNPTPKLISRANNRPILLYFRRHAVYCLIYMQNQSQIGLTVPRDLHSLVHFGVGVWHPYNLALRTLNGTGDVIYNFASLVQFKEYLINETSSLESGAFYSHPFFLLHNSFFQHKIID